MNFRQRNNNFERTGTGKKFVWIGFCVAFLIIIFSFSGPRELLFGIGAPLWGIRNSIGSFFSDNGQLLESKSALVAENTALEGKLENDEENQLLDTDLKNENDDLKAILNRKDIDPKEIVAAVLAKPSLSPYDTLVIDLGSADGISLGDQVLASGDIFIGSVLEVYDHSSKVVLYSSSGQFVNVLVGADAIEKQATGLGGGDFSLEAPIDSNIRVGDPIVMPSISANIFSTVAQIVSKPTDSFETILFKEPVNIFELRWVEVIPSAHINKN